MIVAVKEVTGRLPGSAWIPRTKLVRPAPAKDAILDPELVDRVIESLAELPLTLIAAEAGAGKTTLAAAAVERVTTPVGWISLDEFDDDPHTFVQLLFMALDGIVPGGCPAAAELLGSGLPGTDNPIRMIGILINDVIAAGPLPLVLVLDDLHVIHAGAVMSMLDYLLARLPANTHLLVTSRVEPLLSLARLRARGQLAEIGIEHLRLSIAQADLLLNGHFGLDLSRGAVERIVTAAGGWVTGIRLLARSAGDVAGPLPVLRGPRDFEAVEAYLGAEVFDHEPGDVRRFLVETSVLDELEPAVAAAVTGRDDADALLADLHRRHELLVLVADPATSTYRYHDLFRSFLRRRLHDQGQARVTALHRAAASAVPSPAKRVEHLLSANAWDDAADTIERLADGVFPQAAELQRLSTWVSRLPAETTARRPRLGLLVGTAAVQRGDTGRAVEVLEPALPALEEAADFPGTWLAARCLHLATNDHRRFAPLLARLEHDPRFGDLPAAARVDHHVSSAYGRLFAGQWDEVRQRLETVLALTTTTADVAAAEVLAQHLSPLLAAADGVLGRIEAYASWADRRFPEGPLLVRLGVHHQRALVAFLQARFDEALGAVRAAGDLPERLGGLPYLRATLDWVEAGVSFARGDLWAAEHRIRSALENREATDLDRDLDVLRMGLLARVLRHQGRREELTRLATLVDAAGSETRYADFAAWTAASVRAQEAWAGGHLAKAAELLRTGLAAEDRVRLVPMVGSLRLDLALVLDARGDRPHALTVLADVASKAGRWQAPGMLAVAGQEALPLLAAAAERDVGGTAVRTALTALGRDAPLAPVPVPGSAEILSARELEVLRLLGTGASNRSIAKTLVISENTVKTHVRNLMTKLDAQSRGAAVATARRLHLL